MTGIPCIAAFLVAATDAAAQDEFKGFGMIEPTADVAVKARVDGYVSGSS